MNVYKYRFDLGDSVSRPTPWPTLSLLHQLPLAQEEGPQKPGKENSQTLSPEPSLGLGRVRQRAWQIRSLLKGESGVASTCSLPSGLPRLTLPSGLPLFSAHCCVTSLSPSPCALQTSPSLPPFISQCAHPSPPSLTCSDWTAPFRCASSPMDCALYLSCPFPHSCTFPLHTSSHSFSPASCSIHPQS